MKKFIAFIFCGITFACIANAESININWIVDDETYQQTTCNIGDDLILPTAPTKYGYTFQGWAPYTPIEYIESTGTQWIETNAYLSDNAEFFFDFMKIAFISEQDVGYTGPLAGGGWHNANSSSIAMWLGRVVNYSPQVTKTDIVGKRCTEHWIKRGAVFSSELIVQETQATYNLSTSSATFYSSPIRFLTPDNYNKWQSATRIYGAWLKDGNGDLVADFIPVLDQHGVPCMYDKVTQQFFYNAGTGDFIAGPVIE